MTAPELETRAAFRKLDAAATILHDRLDDLYGPGRRTEAELLERGRLADEVPDLETFLSLAGAGYVTRGEFAAMFRHVFEGIAGWTSVA